MVLEDILNHPLASKILSTLMGNMFPQAKTSVGRRRKVTWLDKIPQTVTGGMLGITITGAMIMFSKEALGMEDFVSVLLYIGKHESNLNADNIRPSSPNWIVRKALIEMGYSEEQIPVVTFDEIFVLGVQLMQEWNTARLLQPSWILAQKQGWRIDQYTEWLQAIKKQAEEQAKKVGQAK